MRFCNFYSLSNEKTKNDIVEKIYNHLYVNGILNKSLNLNDMIDIFTSHKNLVKSLNITIKLLELCEHIKKKLTTPKYTIASLYREVFERKIKNYYNFDNIYNNLNYGNNIYFGTIFNDVKNLIKDPENMKIMDELLEAQYNFTKNYTYDKYSYVQFNSVVDLIVNNTNLEQFDRFTNDYCRFVQDHNANKYN